MPYNDFLQTSLSKFIEKVFFFWKIEFDFRSFFSVQRELEAQITSILI